MSISAMTWAFDQVLNPAQKIVLLALADYADDRGICWPNQETLTTKTNLSVRTIRTHIRALEDAGLVITSERTRADGGRAGNEYQLAMTPPAEFAGAPRRTVAGAPGNQLPGPPGELLPVMNHHLEPPKNHPPAPHKPPPVDDTTGWSGEDECPVRRNPRGPHELDPDRLACAHCNEPDPSIPAARRDELAARRRLARLHDERNLSVALADLEDLARRAGAGDLARGVDAIRDATLESLAGSRDPAAVIRSRLGLPPTETHARRRAAA